MSLHFISDGAGNTNENGESFPVAVDVNPEIFSNEDTQKFFTDALCEEDFILIWVRAVLRVGVFSFHLEFCLAFVAKQYN